MGLQILASTGVPGLLGPADGESDRLQRLERWRSHSGILTGLGRGTAGARIGPGGLARRPVPAAGFPRFTRGEIRRQAASARSAAPVLRSPGPVRGRERPPVHGPPPPRARGIAPTGPL